MKASHSVVITQLDDKTFLVQVGCRQLSFSTFPAAELQRFFADPQGVEVEYTQRFGWKFDNGPAAVGYAEPREAPLNRLR